ncbi:hypothetical protein [Jiangella asiatica]|uniref:Uncharacterized protein n=1 Tax=Jiangella asiatica TaxID=2530372 RepID=A0A4R5DCG6_9ACTN|nr:hypothetical protein [Jiangella asiatica]TDE10667.1 hypothetical protein E1269_11375 [Jiangella asiatica]
MTEARIRDATTAEQQALNIEQRLITDANTLRDLVTDPLRVGASNPLRGDPRAEFGSTAAGLGALIRMRSFDSETS